jgi:hypothetical protein
MAQYGAAVQVQLEEALGFGMHMSAAIRAVSERAPCWHESGRCIAHPVFSSLPSH